MILLETSALYKLFTYTLLTYLLTKLKYDRTRSLLHLTLMVTVYGIYNVTYKTFI